MTEDLLYMIEDLISLKYEGGYWDFKKEWPSDKASLLHDIICMANNLEDRDSYLIYGVDEINDFEVMDVSPDKNRRNTNELVTFLRDRKFQGGIRPTVTVKNLIFTDSTTIDVIEIKNTRNTPYTLIEDFPGDKKTLRANCVYTRVGDTNTPIDKTADLDKVEYLWKKRFAINETALQRVEKYLNDPYDWEYYDEDGMFYHRTFPEFTMQVKDTYHDDREKYFDRSEFYCKQFPDRNTYHWEDFEIKYHQTVIYKWIAAYLDGGRHLIAIPESKMINRNGEEWGMHNWFRLFYYDKDNIIGKVNHVFLSLYPGDHSYHRNGPLAKNIVIFSDDEERDKFCKYLTDKKAEGEFPQLLFFDEFEKTIDEGKDRGEQVEEWERKTMYALNDIFDEWRNNG